MKRFVFELDAVLRYRRSRRDLCRQVLARVVADDRAQGGRQASIRRRRGFQLDELRAIGRGDRLDVDRSMARRFHASQLQAELHAVERNRALLAQQIDMCRRMLVEADRDVKVLEKLRDRRESAHRLAEERRALHEIEDAWTALRSGSTKL